MRIGIDISQVVYGTGVSVYTENLVRSLLLEDKENTYVLFGGSMRRRAVIKRCLESFKGNFESKIFPIPPAMADFIWNKLHLLKIEKLVGDLDVFHSSDWTQPPSDAYKVTTVHDLAPLRFPKYSHPRVVSAHKARLRWVREQVDRIIVPSLATKKDLMNLGIDEKRVYVIPEAPDPIFKPASKQDVMNLKREYRIEGAYLLAVGTNPRKNIQRIIRAFEKVRAGRNLKLIVLGHPHATFEAERGVRFIGHVEKEKLPVFYSGAEALVYASFYEGFGLPILEAFSCKTPVVTSNISSLPEVAGKAAELVDPYEVDSIAEGIERALRRKKGLIKKGLTQVKKFSWQRTARETLRVYKEARNGT